MQRARVVLEVGSKRVFASAVDWPGWARSGRTAEDALTALADYAPRYATVAGLAGVAFAAPTGYDVVEEVTGNATTDFGAPGVPAKADGEALSTKEAVRQVALLRVAWAALDRLARDAPETLRKGPRGGGRDRDKVVAHVLSAEQSYARKVGAKHEEPALGDTAAIEALRADLVAVLGRASDGAALAPGGWSARYALRRVTWHVLDHVWEIEDRS